MKKISRRSKVRFSIQFKIVLLFLSLSFVLIVAESLLDFTYSRDDLEKRILSDFAAIARTKTEIIKTVAEEDIEDARDLANRLLLREALTQIDAGSAGREKLITRIGQSITAALESTLTVTGADIIDNAGTVIFATRPEDTGKDFSRDMAFIRGRAGQWVGEPYMENGVFTYDISVPIFGPHDEKQQVIGVARARVNATRLYNILRDYEGLGSSGETVLAKRITGGMAFVGPLRHRENMDSQLRIPMASAYAEPMRRALGGQSGIVTSLDYRGVTVLAAYSYIPVNGWGLVIKIDRKEAFAPIERLRRRIVSAAVVLFLLSVAVIVVLARMISRPIRNLRRGMMVVAGGDLDHRLRVRTGDEIGALAEAFNDMTASLKKITVSHESLDKEVKERKAAEEKLKEALKARTNFMSMVSHELRTPLAAIREGIGIILDGILGSLNAEQRDYLTRAKANVERLTRLINDILDFQKLESGKMVLVTAVHDLRETVREIYDTMNPWARQKGLDFTLKVDRDLPRITFDKDKIAQVFANLINNAIKYTEHGSVAVIVSHEEGFAHVMVKDTGAGIREQDMSRLFRSFEQLEDTSRHKGGTGLGLAISKEIVELHGGEMWAESEVGVGTTIHFTLPA